MAISYNGHTVGVICELNPLHNGHAYLLSEARRLVGEDGCVICVMSGKTTQRGEFAVLEPYARARTALTAGADLVVELPFPWSSGSAEHFAMGGVSILSQMGCTHLLFGSECGELSLMRRAADLISSAEFTEVYASLCRDGVGTATAYTQALRRSDSTLPESFPSSNDLLGIAYLAAIQRLGSDMEPHTVRRLGQDYRDELLTNAAYPSATSLRKLIQEAACDPVCLSAVLDGTMPQDALEILLSEIREERAPVSMDAFYRYAHTHFRLLSVREDNDIAEGGDGLICHLQKRALASCSFEEFLASAETKQYTKARLRRAILFAVSGVTVQDLRNRPSYSVVLAASQRGRAFLSVWRKCALADEFTLVTKPADAPESRQRVLGERIDALYTFCFPAPHDAGWFMRKTPLIEK